MLKAFILALLGATPGFYIAIEHGRFGLAWAFVGAVFASCFAIPGVKLERVTRLTAAMILLKNLGVGDGLISTENELADEELPLNNKMKDWIMGRDLEERKGRLVGIAMIVGVLVVGIVLLHDFVFCKESNYRFTTRVFGEQSQFDSVILALAVLPPIFGGLVAVLFCPAYRRPILFFSMVPTLAFVAMLIAGDDKAINILAFLVVATWLGLICGLALGYEE